MAISMYLWDAINAYTVACGGDTIHCDDSRRKTAVAALECAVTKFVEVQTAEYRASVIMDVVTALESVQLKCREQIERVRKIGIAR